METADFERLRGRPPPKNNKLRPAVPMLPRHKRGETFLKGPVPLGWLAQAACLPGKALHVGVFLWFLAGLKNTCVVLLANGRLSGFGVNRSAKYRALNSLEAAGLVSVQRRRGRSPRVTLLEAPAR